MASFYKIDVYRALPEVYGSSMDMDEAYDAVNNGQDVWTQRYSDARDLADRFGGGYRDNIHFDVRDRPGQKFTLEHFHPSNARGHAHICFGDAINDHDDSHIYRLR